MKRIEPIVLRFARADLLYDIKNYAYVEGDIMLSDDEHIKHQVFDICEEGNIDRVNRVLSIAHAEIVEKLYPHTKVSLSEALELDSGLREPDEYVVTLHLSDSFAGSSVILVRELIHEYLVCRVLQDWLSITKPESRDNWQMKLDDCVAKLHSVLVDRSKPVRIRMNPF